MPDPALRLIAEMDELRGRVERLERRSGSLYVVERVILGAAQASVIFADIPDAYGDLELRWHARGTKADTEVLLYMRFNGDSSGIYHFETLAGDDAAPWAEEGIAQDHLFIGSITGGNADTNVFSSGRVYIPAYQSSLSCRQFYGLSNFYEDNTSGNIRVNVSGGFWRSRQSISSITLYPDANNFAVGSEFTLYGIP